MYKELSLSEALDYVWENGHTYGTKGERASEVYDELKDILNEIDAEEHTTITVEE